MATADKAETTMISKVEFTNRRKAETTPGRPDWAMISITAPGEEAELIPGWHSVLRLQFHDADPDRTTKRRKDERILLDEAMARELIKYVEGVAQEVDTIVIHCQGGISRSAAVAKWIADRYHLNFDHNYALHNRHVYSTLVTVDRRRFYG